MQSGGRYQAVLDLISEIFKDEKPADGLINDYLRARKYIGSKDRRFITDTVWTILRNRMKLEFDAQSREPRRILLWYAKDRLNEVFDGSRYGMAPLTEEEKKFLACFREEAYPAYVEAECPQWLFEKIGDVALCKALNQPAPADFRVNFTSREEALRRLEDEGIDAAPTPYSPLGIRVDGRLNLGACMTYQDGLIEVQDEASQLAALLCDVRPGHKIMDYCCGAGGKSLTLSHLLQNRGHILAHDVNSRRLEAIRPRLARLGVKNIELTEIVADNDRDFDRFIIDAPCSGTGTWRRAPDGKYRLSPGLLKGLVITQAELLEIGAAKTRKGGRLIYITCSVLPEEDELAIEAFLTRHKDFVSADIAGLWRRLTGCSYPGTSGRYCRLSPLTTGTDGFFVAVLEKKA